jgi:hypothetical protein
MPPSFGSRLAFAYELRSLAERLNTTHWPSGEYAG